VVQAVDVDALHAEGLDLDLEDQMKDLSVVGDDEDVKDSQTDV